LNNVLKIYFQNKMKNLGILSLQGDIEEVENYFSDFANIVFIKNKKDLDNIDFIVLPGGESTTIGKLLNRNKLKKPLTEKIKSGIPTLAVCAGAILLGKTSPYSMNILDFETERNAYGRQINSFSAKINLDIFEKKFNCTFIRAPKFFNLTKNIKILGEYKKFPILLKKNNIIVASFHPELEKNDDRFAKWFINLEQDL